MAERFYDPNAASYAGGRFTLEGDEAHHLGRVRRIGAGEVVEVFDGLGFATRAEVIAVGKKSVELQPVGVPLPLHEPPARLTLATAVPKGDRFDWLVEKATELGVDRLIPLQTERSVVDPGPAKIGRLRRAVIEAAKQCGRNRLMMLDDPRPWPEVVGEFVAERVKIVAHPGGSSFGQWSHPAPGDRAVVAIGPEGGLTDSEIETAEAAGWGRVSLGTHVLRVETAALVAAVRLLALAEA